MICSQAVAPSGQFLSTERSVEMLQAGLGNKFHSQRVLVLIPDHTRSLPLPFLFRALVKILCDTRQLDFVEGHQLSGMFIGDYLSAWGSAADLSAERHIAWCQRPYQRVLSCAPSMYDELWTCAKAMYKLEPAVAAGGEVIIYAPHLEVVSQVHGRHIYEIGYHTLPYFLHQWDRFKHIPLGVLAHSTHLRGLGSMENGIEKANVKVTLASKISAEDCARLKLGYLDPSRINLNEWQNRESEGILFVARAGEMLFRMK